MKNIEYTKMAYLYDKFYVNKNYSKEVDFITSFIKENNCKILDAGCGTGTHANIFYNLGYDISGFDKSNDMVDIANKKLEEHFFVDDLLDFKSNDKYDLIISFFAVFNHLKNYKEFEIALSNLKSNLKENGKIIIDLHNPQKSGKKVEKIEDASRIMKWKKCNLLKKEFTKITYIVEGKSFKTAHTFKIYDINKLRKIVLKLGFNSVEFYENYNVTKKASVNSKNIQMVISL